MSDKLSDDERARERFRAAMSPLPCEWSERDGKFMDAGVQLAWFAWNKALAASPAPAISAHTRAWIEKLIDCFDVDDMKNIGPDDASCYVNALREMLDARSAPVISESEDAVKDT
ncbi:hypothetical protein B7759_01354 [Burkholderia glumae]|uniref:hypothetical protein n=1 Tax=Burkholderia glumae TaxID=337 RepID=UPI001AE19D3C|nr:hypothetical protein [Burkholderia glumae]QTP32776.1 hypothetical protein B7759_01354 [Burkholderia glumae]